MIDMEHVRTVKYLGGKHVITADCILVREGNTIKFC